MSLLFGFPYHVSKCQNLVFQLVNGTGPVGDPRRGEPFGIGLAQQPRASLWRRIGPNVTSQGIGEMLAYPEVKTALKDEVSELIGNRSIEWVVLGVLVGWAVGPLGSRGGLRFELAVLMAAARSPPSSTLVHLWESGAVAEEVGWRALEGFS